MLLLKEEPKTVEIKDVEQLSTGGWRIHFLRQERTYYYSQDSVRWLQDGEELDPEEYRLVRRDGVVLYNLVGLWCFKDGEQLYWRVRYESGKEQEYKADQLEVLANLLASPKVRPIFSYMKRVAEHNRLGATEDSLGILAKTYARLEFVDPASAAACYLDPLACGAASYAPCPDLIYPFGCNASQRAAMTRAFEHQLSVIQGPPGTGKTQTILNIIANILVQGKTVLVVSSNSSALSNIVEKLEKQGLSFFLAQLGSKKDQEAFLEKQVPRPEELATWRLERGERLDLEEDLKQALAQLDHVYALQTELAELRQELQALELEQLHFEQRQPSDTTPRLSLHVPASKLLERLLRIQLLAEPEQPSRWIRLQLWIQLLWCRYVWRLPIAVDPEELGELELILQSNYYRLRLEELKTRIGSVEQQLGSYDVEQLSEQLRSYSLTLFRAHLAAYYEGERPIFENGTDLWKRGKLCRKEYPVVLSTCFSARNCLLDPDLYDYLIVDEASQVSVETGTLALSCARRVVVVGDTLQLPNIITKDDERILAGLVEEYQVADYYDGRKHSLLSSIIAALPEVPQTLLREHYRCHPQIIEFCNQRFYGGQLLVMTRAGEEDKALTAVYTRPGQHAVKHHNQREIDVILQELLPQISEAKEVGVITPYRQQVAELSAQRTGLEVATVHSYQGQERDIIIMSVVDNQIGEFVDKPELLNVAVSRAKEHFYLVVSGNEQQRRGHVQALLDYIAYIGCEQRQSKIGSIYDYLYVQYTEQRIALLRQLPHVSSYASECLTYGMLTELLASDVRLAGLQVLCHVPLRDFLVDLSPCSRQEKRYICHEHSHVDFLISERATHLPFLAIEVDGYTFHRKESKQRKRDERKDKILELYQLPLLRLSTKGSQEADRVRGELERLLALAN